MSKKKPYVVMKHSADGLGKPTSEQVGHASKTPAGANALKARMRAQDAQRSGSSWYTTETKK